MTSEPTVAVGRISRPHGVSGELSVVVLSEVSSRFDPGSVLLLENGSSLTVRSSRKHGAALLVTFEEVRTREEGKALSGRLLSVSATSSPPPPEGTWWDHDIIGCSVSTDSGRALGAVDDVIHTPANDVWSVIGDGGTESLIPVLTEVIVEVDTAAKAIVVREVPGLTTEEAE